MISVQEAARILQDSASRLAARRIALDQVLGLELADDVVSPINVPAFRKALMDGVAVRSSDLGDCGDSFPVQSTIVAGDPAHCELESGHVCRVMTGATVPAGADTVIPFEELADAVPDWQRATSVRFRQPPRPHQNMIGIGEIVRAGDTVLKAGKTVTPSVQAFLMELGLPDVVAYPRVNAAVLSTGTELVEWPAEPPPGSIRNTNGPMLAALFREFGCLVEYLGVAADDESALAEKLEKGLRADLLVVTGGVSVGDRDLVPALLRQFLVREQFHGVAVKPGKPLWFGLREGTYVFGLPGNPVSALVGFHVFIRPLLSHVRGREPHADWVEAPLAEPYAFSGRRETYLPALITTDGQVQILPWHGSSDLRTLAIATGLVRFLEGNTRYATGDRVPYLTMSCLRDGDT